MILGRRKRGAGALRWARGDMQLYISATRAPASLQSRECNLQGLPSRMRQKQLNSFPDNRVMARPAAVEGNAMVRLDHRNEKYHYTRRTPHE